MIKTTRNDAVSNSAYMERRIYFGVRKSVRYEDTFFAGWYESDFVLKLITCKWKRKQATN